MRVYRRPPAVRHILRAPQVQAKLKIGAVDDPAEREADRVADQVMRMPVRDFGGVVNPLLPPGSTIASPVASPRVQRSCPACEHEMQRKESGAGSPGPAEFEGGGTVPAVNQSSAIPDRIMRQETSVPGSAAGGGRPVYLCTKPILGTGVHGQGHAFFRVGGSTPGHPTFELEHARSCYCGWQGWPRRDVPEDRDADVPCVPTPIDEAMLTANWNAYPVGQYCARGPNSNTYVRVISAKCGSTIRPPGSIAGYDASPPAAGGAGAPHPYLSVLACWSVDCDDTECGLIPGINSDIVPGDDPEALNDSGDAPEPAALSEPSAADEEQAIA